MHTASACFASFWALHLLSAACFGTRVANKLTSLMHSLGATVQATLFLLSAEAVALQSDLYGESAAVAQLFAFSLGFFLYDVLYEAVLVPVVQKAAPEPGFVVHGVACSACYYFGLRPFLHHMGSIMLLNEASTVLLNARALLLLSGRDSGRLFAAVQTTFGLTFIGVRLVVAIPASVYWWGDMLALLRSGTAHSVPICIYYLAANILLNGLNVYWAILIVKKALRPKGASKRGMD